ncbi:hypothetical protein JCM19037_2212 [Geomicrobium sp. JCM 19037]|nr:hypothetical protein JCM19037_2212 [Geomicrobium sp. JCM 19037]
MVKERILDGTYLPGQRIVIDQIAKEVGPVIFLSEKPFANLRPINTLNTVPMLVQLLRELMPKLTKKRFSFSQF